MTGPIEETNVEETMGDLLDSVEPMKPLRRGDVVEGVVMRSDPEGVLLNIGHKAEGLVPAAEMKTLERDGVGPLNIGDEIVAFVVKGESAEGSAILSIDKAAGEKGWRMLEKALQAGEKVTGTVMGFNRGGAIVEVDGVQCFVPMSQLVTVSRDNFRDVLAPQVPSSTNGETSDSKSEGDTEAEPAGEAEAEPEPEPEPEPEVEPEEEKEPEQPPDIGKELTLKVLEVNRSRNRAILSERQAVQDQREERKAKLIEELAEGEVRRGKVTGISSFGAFVDLGGADGLVHISELSWTPVGSPEEVVKVGEELDVYVLRVDAENKKIALSLKRLQREPWETVNERFQVGDVVDATVTKLTDFGAFARVEGSVEGLIHISELASRMVNHPRDVVREGDTVKLKILRIEPERRRLGLSLRQAMEEEEEFADLGGNADADLGE